MKQCLKPKHTWVQSPPTTDPRAQNNGHLEHVKQRRKGYKNGIKGLEKTNSTRTHVGMLQEFLNLCTVNCVKFKLQGWGQKKKMDKATLAYHHKPHAHTHTIVKTKIICMFFVSQHKTAVESESSCEKTSCQTADASVKDCSAGFTHFCRTISNWQMTCHNAQSQQLGAVAQMQVRQFCFVFFFFFCLLQKPSRQGIMRDGQTPSTRHTWSSAATSLQRLPPNTTRYADHAASISEELLGNTYTIRPILATHHDRWIVP